MKQALFKIEQSQSYRNRYLPANELARLICAFAQTSRLSGDDMLELQKLAAYLNFKIEIIE